MRHPMLSHRVPREKRRVMGRTPDPMGRPTGTLSVTDRVTSILVQKGLISKAGSYHINTTTLAKLEVGSQESLARVFNAS